MSPEDYANVINGICSKLNIRPDDTLMLNVTQYCRNKNLTKLLNQTGTQDKLNQFLTDSYIKHVSGDGVKEELKMIEDKALAMHKKPAKSNLKQNSIMGPLSQWVSRSMHIDIDSMNRNISEDRGQFITDFRFILSSRNDRAPLGTGIIPSRLIPANITYMKIGKIILPYDSTLGNLNYTQELTLSFTGIRSNGAIISNLSTNETIHFSFTYTACTFNEQLVELRPVNKYCKFDPPLTYLDDLSFRFNEPRYVAQFSKDRLTPISFDYNSPNGVISFSEPHNLVDGDIVIVHGLTTLNDSANTTILNTINNNRGLKIVAVDDTNITIGVDFTTIIDPDVSSLPLVIFVSKTFHMMLEIGYTEDDNEYSSKSNPYKNMRS